MLKAEKDGGIVERDSSDIGWRNTKAKTDRIEKLVRFTSGIWPAQKNYSAVKKEIIRVINCIKQFKIDLLIKIF